MNHALQEKGARVAGRKFIPLVQIGAIVFFYVTGAEIAKRIFHRRTSA
jgi:hypothetical protein